MASTNQFLKCSLASFSLVQGNKLSLQQATATACSWPAGQHVMQAPEQTALLCPICEARLTQLVLALTKRPYTDHDLHPLLS